MEEAIVSFLLNKVDGYLANEVSLLYGVAGQVRSLEFELKQLQHFLSKAVRSREEENDVKEWLRQLSDYAYTAEDILDEFVLKNELRRHNRYAIFLRDVPAHRRVGESIVRVNENLKEIFKRKDQYSIKVIMNNNGAVLGPTRALRDPNRRDNQMDGVIVGFEDQEKWVVQRLLAVTGQGDDELRVVSIYGMGGLGKTTLAKKVHGNASVHSTFERMVWVSLSQYFPEDKLLRELIQKTLGSDDGGDVVRDLKREELRGKLNENLKGSRFLIVMDDVWEKELWDSIKPAFRGIENGSRVLLTTRSLEVAKAADPSRDPCQLRLLNEDESWELFNWKVFNKRDECPGDLVDKGKQLVKKCKNLPLAIVILGGLLSLKSKNILEWSKVLKTLDWRFDPNMKGCAEVLALSYHDMPSYLKPCFLYFGLFPEDSEIRSSKLKMLWIAEGFTEEDEKIKDQMTAEQIAEDYLEELYQRSLIQVVSKKSYGGSKTCGIKSCCIHDLLRDLAIAQAKDFEFLTVHGVREREKNFPPRARRRLAIQCHVDEQRNNQPWLNLEVSSPKLRSLLCFNQRQLNMIRIDKLKLLRVIDLKDVTLEQLPVPIGTLIFLRFLGLNHTGLKNLPDSVGNLFNLLTLDIRSNGEMIVPLSIWKMKKLRHFYLDWDAPLQIDDLPNIQTLNGIPADVWIGTSLAKLTSLTRLVITKISHNHGDALSAALPQLKCLNYLGLKGTSSIPTNLQLGNLNDLFLLTLYGKLDRLPNVAGFPTNLMKLSLRSTRLREDPLPILGQLKSLESLKLLKESYLGTKMVCTPSSFPKLKFFTLDELDRLEEWEVKKGAMISLKRLVISNCLSLKMLPEGVKDASYLQELELVGMPSTFRSRFRKDEGEDLHKIRRSLSISLIIR